MSRALDFRSTITSLWFRLITLGIVALVFAEALFLAQGKAQGWSFYLTIPEVAFEVVVRLVFAALAGMAVGTICTAVLAPFLWYFSSSRERIADWAIQVAVVLVVFLDGWYAMSALIKWSYQWFEHRAIFDILLLAAYFLVLAVALCIPRARRSVVTSLDVFLTEKMTRRTAIATVAGTAALVATELALGRTAPAVKAAVVPDRPKRNFLLITFDALDAEDMSLYGRPLPTTPNIDAFARNGTVFTNFYSACTFTTPSVATMMTGLYPSESQIYQLQGRVRADETGKSLPHLMRAAGFATGAFLTNPFAYYLATSLRNGYDLLPEPAFQPGGLQHLWDATRPLHQDTGFGDRNDEYRDLEDVWNFMGRMPPSLSMRMRPTTSFEQAREVLAQLPDGYFMWVHLVTPHNPYLPDPEERGRFLPPEKVTTYEDELGGRWKPHYPPDQQKLVDERRLRYDEFIATGDRAFGAFMSDLESAGKLRDTTVIVSADHGEGFDGGVYQHSSPYLTRPVIHIPLIIRTPGQQGTRKVAFTADQTSLAPTILELAGLPRPDWMRGQSLVEWLNRDGQGEGEGLAFCQYFERNSVFKPLHHGTVGVIDGQYQYIVYLDTQKGELRPLNEAQIWNLDRSAENPARAEALRQVLRSRFPDLVQTPA